MSNLQPFLILRRLRAALKTATLDEILVIQKNLETIKQEKEQELINIQAQEKEHKQRVEEIKAMMQKWGLTSSDLDERGYLKNPDSPKRKLKPKYQITLPSGEVKTWTGRGKVPLVFRNVNLQDYLIK